MGAACCWTISLSLGIRCSDLIPEATMPQLRETRTEGERETEGGEEQQPANEELHSPRPSQPWSWSRLRSSSGPGPEPGPQQPLQESARWAVLALGASHSQVEEWSSQLSEL